MNPTDLDSESSVSTPAEERPPRKSSRPAVILTVGLWGVAVVTGMGLMLFYEKNPGRAAEAPSRWPAASRIARQPGRSTLLMIMHPRCPCSSASVEQLERVLTRIHRPLQAVVLMVRPAGTPPGWERTPLWNQVAAIPNVAVMTDAQGIEAARFGSWTSGQVLLYDDAGCLRFSGGITGSRGMAGDNAGEQAARAQIESAAARGVAGSSVYGCELGAPDGAAPGESR